MVKLTLKGGGEGAGQGGEVLGVRPLEFEHPVQPHQGDGSDGDDDARGVLEAPDDDDLGEPAHHRAEHHRQGQGDPVVEAVHLDHPDRQHADQAADGAVGEVDEPLGPVHEDQAHGPQRVGRAVDRPHQDVAEGRMAVHVSVVAAHDLGQHVGHDQAADADGPPRWLRQLLPVVEAAAAPL